MMALKRAIYVALRVLTPRYAWTGSRPAKSSFLQCDLAAGTALADIMWRRHALILASGIPMRMPSGLAFGGSAVVDATSRVVRIAASSY